MHIQTIQSTQNNKNTSFKARFINDKNGYFQELWTSAYKSKSLFDKAKHFNKTHPNDTLEIVGIKNCDIITDGYEVFNHNTGSKSLYKMKSVTKKEGVLSNLLDLINNDKQIFEKNYSNKIYNLLLGKN